MKKLKKDIIQEAVESLGECSVIQVAEKTGFGKPIVTDTIRKLTDAGLVAVRRELINGTWNNVYMPIVVPAPLKMITNITQHSIYGLKPEGKRRKGFIPEPVKHVSGTYGGKGI